MNCTRLELSLVLTLFGNSEIGGRVYSDPGNLISLRQLLIGKSNKSDIFFQERLIFLYTGAACSQLTSNMITTDIERNGNITSCVEQKYFLVVSDRFPILFTSAATTNERRNQTIELELNVSNPAVS